MPFSRVLLLSFVSLFTASAVQAQSIEIFVEPGVEIIGHPSNENLDSVSQNAVGITNDGHVIFEGVTLIEFMPGFFFPVSNILLAENKNQVDYLIGNGATLGPYTVDWGTDRDVDLHVNHNGDYCFTTLLRHESGDPQFNKSDALFLSHISSPPSSFEILDTKINNIIQLSEKGNILYSGRNAVANRDALKLASLEETSILLTELGPLAGNPGSFVWSDEYENDDDLNARLQESDDPLIGDKVFFGRPFLNDFPQSSNKLFDGYAAYAYQEDAGGYELTLSIQAQKLIPHPFEAAQGDLVDKYLVWVDSSSLTTGYYLQTAGDPISAANLIVATDNPTAPLIDPDGRIHFHDTDGGISRYDPDSEILSKVILASSVGEVAVDVFGFSDSGLLILLARDGDDIESLWTYNPLNSALNKLLDALTIVEGKTVGKFLQNRNNDEETLSRWPGIAMAGKYIALATDIGVLRINLEGEPTTSFTWTGEATDGKWSTAANWKDASTDLPAILAPGDPSGEGPTESALINDAFVTISESPVSINVINATGTLVATQPLTIGANSTINNFWQQSDLTLNGDLTLTGEATILESGVLSGTNNLKTTGSVSLVNAKFEIGLDNHGQFTLANTANLVPTGPIGVTNQAGGKLIKEGGGVSRILSLLFENMGSIETTSGELHLEQDIFYLKGGELLAGVDTVIQLDEPNVPDVEWDSTVVVEGTNLLSGDGEIRLENVRLEIKDEAVLKVDLNNPGKPFLLNNDLNTFGNGQMVNLDTMEWTSGTVTGGTFATNLVAGGLKNEVALTIQNSGTPDKIFKLSSGVIENTGVMFQHHSIELSGSSTIVNREGGLYFIADGSNFLIDPESTDGKLVNEGEIGTIDPGTTLVQVPFINTGGKLHVGNGSLILSGNSEFSKFGTIEVSENATFIPGTGEHAFKDLTLLSGHGQVSLSSGGLNITESLWVNMGTEKGKAFNKDGNFILSGGTIAGPGEFLNFGNFDWQSGTVSGNLRISPDEEDASFLITGEGQKTLNGILSNEGSIFHEGPLTMDGGTIHHTGELYQISAPIIGDAQNKFINGGILWFGTFDGARILDYSISFHDPGPGGEMVILPTTFIELKGPMTVVNSDVPDSDLNFGQTFPLLENGTLTGAKVTLAPESSLTIPGGAIDTLRGASVLEFSGDGLLNNLPNGSGSTGDFSIFNYSKMFLRDDANFNVEGQLNIGRGELRVLDSKVFVNGDLEMGSNIADLLGVPLPSTLVINTGGIVTVEDQFEVLKGGVVNMNGTLTADSLDIRSGASFAGSGTINGSSFNNAGELIPGSSPGILTINGDFTQTAEGVLRIEIHGSIPADSQDQLIINGNATLGGTLIISSSKDFNWTQDVPSPLILATQIEGEFDKIILAADSSRRVAATDSIDGKLTVSSETITFPNFIDWRGAHFTDADLLDESISGPLADPDYDGTGNFLEYVFDYIPKFADAQDPVFDVQLNETEDKRLIAVTFPWAHGMTDVEYTLQTSPDLNTWIDLDSTVAESIEGEFADILTLSAEMDVAENVPFFGRLLVKVNGL